MKWKTRCFYFNLLNISPTSTFIIYWNTYLSSSLNIIRDSFDSLQLISLCISLKWNYFLYRSILVSIGIWFSDKEDINTNTAYTMWELWHLYKFWRQEQRWQYLTHIIYSNNAGHHIYNYVFSKWNRFIVLFKGSHIDIVLTNK